MKNIKDLKRVTKIGAAIRRELVWQQAANEDNLDFLRETSGDPDVQIGDVVDIKAEVYIKKLSFKAARDASKSFNWKINEKDIEASELKSVDADRLQASHLCGTICVDSAGTPFFENLQAVYDSEPSFINALYKLADEINNFMGKSQKKSSSDTNSSLNLSPVESVEEQLQKPNET